MKVLIAEDEKDLREILKLNLESEGYSVLCAKNGEEALELFNNNDIDIAIFDVMMPLLDGFNLLLKIRKVSDVPVIMLTARAEDMDKTLAFGIGADDYLVKPFSMIELMARITVRLKAQRKKTAVIAIDDLVLNAEECSITRDGIQLELNSKEFLILKLLMESPNRVFTKKQIYSAVWKDDFVYDDNTIMVHISRIRNKIEYDSRRPQYVKTVKGIGYKFSEEVKE